MTGKAGEAEKHTDEKRVQPIEEALTAFTGIDVYRGENHSLGNFQREIEKGIPFISFIVKEKEGAVFIRPHPLFMAGSFLKEQKTEVSEIL